MKYKVLITWSSGVVEEIQCETLMLAKLCIEAFREHNAIKFISLRELVNGKWEIR